MATSASPGETGAAESPVELSQSMCSIRHDLLEITIMIDAENIVDVLQMLCDSPSFVVKDYYIILEGCAFCTVSPSSDKAPQHRIRVRNTELGGNTVSKGSSDAKLNFRVVYEAKLFLLARPAQRQLSTCSCR